MNALEEYPAPICAYSLRKLIGGYVGDTCEREMSGYVSVWYDQSGNGNDAHWNFETETNSMLWDLRYEMAHDFLNLALEMGLETKIKFPTCIVQTGLETATIKS